MNRNSKACTILVLLVVLGTIASGCPMSDPCREFRDLGTQRAAIDKKMNLDMRGDFKVDVSTASVYLAMAPIPPDKIDPEAVKLSHKLDAMPMNQQKRCLQSFIDGYKDGFK